MEVQVQNTVTLEWSIVNVADYDLINNFCIFGAEYDLSPYNNVNVRVADTPNELATSESDIGTVVGIKDEIIIVAGLSDEVITVADIESEIVTAVGMEAQIRDVTAEPLRQSIIDGNANAGRAETAADASEASAVDSEDSYQRALLVEPEVVAQGDVQELRVIAEGDTQIARVGLQGDIQDQRVINEGDTQVARLVANVDVAEDSAGWADADARQADAWANTAVNEDVIRFTWDEVNDVLIQEPMIGQRSSFHWQTIAQTVAAGLKYQGTWDSVDCSVPPIPAPPAGELANGYFYIVTSATGDTALCPNLSIGDWIVWSGDLSGDGTVEGQWAIVDWTFDWSAITGVPENVSNALSRSGGTMTAPALVSYDASVPSANEYVARSYIDALTALFMPINAALPFTAVPRTTAAQGTDANELAKREFVDATFLKLAGGNMSGTIILDNDIRIYGRTVGGTQANLIHINSTDIIEVSEDTVNTVIRGLTANFINSVPTTSMAQGTAVNELTRKDYVDGRVVEVTQAEYDALTPDETVMYAIIG